MFREPHKSSAEATAAKAAQYCQFWPRAAAEQMLKLVEECKLSDALLADVTATNQGLGVKAGFAAEVLHKETFNLDAILKDDSVRAFTDKCNETPLRSNHPTHDIVLVDGGETVGSAQLKYYKDADTTAKQFRELGTDGSPYYKDTESMVGPSDQLQGIKDAARKTELKEQANRSPVADAAKDVQAKATDRLSHDGVESKPLTKNEAEQLAKGDDAARQKHEDIQGVYKTTSTVQQSLRAAKSAAIVTTVVAGTINVIKALDDVRSGRLEPKEAVAQVLKETGIAAADAALKAGAGTAVVSLTAKALPNVFSGSALQTGLATGGIAGATICAVDLAECLVLVAMGKMTPAQLETRTGKNILQTTAGVFGSAVGGAVGAPAGPIGVLVGSFVGGMIASVAATVAIENGIEKPFNESLANATNMIDAQTLMSRSVDYLVVGQRVYGQLAVELAVSEKVFSERMVAIHDASATTRKRIENL
ncbi:hypothetical protein KPL74_20725 [Bacillus sp. NP157]|nr:hypothetical protein KPL74_20725 [Bacillus sp. NP157]